jgi:Carboxypeptidase regulatory-like domain/TonB dependent receptor
MTTKSILRHALAAILVLTFSILPTYAQVVTAGATGVVRDNAGKPIPGAEVTAVHVPTGTTYTAATNSGGTFNFRGIIAGGPYTISAKASGFKSGGQSDLEAQLGSDITVPIVLEPGSEVVTLEKFVVKGEANELDSSATGAGNVYGSQRIVNKPTTQRSLADLISASPFVTLRALSGDREEAQITALGQNNRYNSIQIDGSRINDQFGLNGTGLASFYNPLSLDTLDQLSVQVSPYEVRQSGFTGASINAVTKSGTNHFHGSYYYYFSGDRLFGQQTQGEDVLTKINSGVKVVPKLERTTYGGTFGGPILRDRLFFFLNLEKFERIAPPTATTLTGIDAAQLASIKTAFAKYNTDSGKVIGWGDLGGNASNVSKDKKYLAKIDWNIMSGQRLSVRYSQTEGTVPQFGSFSLTSLTNTNVTPNLSASAVTAFDSNFYAQIRKEKNFTAQLFSRWTPSFTTELKFGTVQQDQATPVNATGPEVDIFGVTGVSRTGATTTAGAIVAGTDLFRQGNAVAVDTKQFSATGDYVYKNFVFSGGVEREENNFWNLFRQSSYGQAIFASVADFVNDVPARITRNFYDPAKRNVADISDFTTNGIFGQVKWNINPRLNLLAGLRYEYSETKKVPAFNQQLFTDSGLVNTGTLDGQNYISPRVSFNYSVDDERKTQLRGGVGHFLGRAPWVFFSNSYNAIGVGSFTVSNNGAAAGTFTNYLKTQFDPANPIGVGADNTGAAREVDFADPGIKLPAVWRGNIALDKKLDFLTSTVSIEAVFTKIDQALFITNENIKSIGLGADGRMRFAGAPSTTVANKSVNGRFANFTDLYRISNVSTGESTYVTLAWSRPMKNRWGLDLSYTHGRSTEAQAIGQTTAAGQWQRNVVFNQGPVELGRSDFEIKHRVVASYSREFEFIKSWRTTVAVNYEGRSGNPFSWIYSNDLNGDGTSSDTVAVPTDINDPRFNFTGMSDADSQKYLAFFKSSGLAQFAGGYAPKNAFVQPWVNKLDLHFSQIVPLHFKTSQLEVFFDWTNFGSFINRHLFNYYEEAFRNTNDVFRRQFIGSAVYGTDGRIIPQKSSATAATFTAFNPDAFTYDNTQSRWRIAFGARLKF